MNKSETLSHISAETGVPKHTVDVVLSSFTSMVSATLAAGGEVALPGLGTFKTAQRAARDGRNPLTGDKIEVPAKTVPKFTAASALKAATDTPKKKRK